MNSAQHSNKVAFADGATFTVGSRTYELSLVSTWTTITGQKVTNGYVNMHCATSGHGWGGEITVEEWDRLQ